MKLACVTRQLHPRQLFRIARARRNEVQNVFVRLEQDGIFGYGEASPNAFYGESAEGVSEKLGAAAGFLEELKITSAAEIKVAWSELWPIVATSRAALCALDLALWDWLGKKESTTVSELAWGKAPAPVRTFCTIGLSMPEELAQKITEAKDFPMIKVKSDEHADFVSLAAVRDRSDAILAVDANCAWGALNLEELASKLLQLGVEFIEQPLPPSEDFRLPHLAGGPPIFADESCVTADDVERIAPFFGGFNIKLVKCGGITPAIEMVRRGRELGLKIMVGCMLESSTLIAAGAVIAQRTDYADLDGAWLLNDDPFLGWSFKNGTLNAPSSWGLGVNPVTSIFTEAV